MHVLYVCRVPKRAEVLKVFRDWHVCYHGTPVESVACILDCGQLMIRGTVGGTYSMTPHL